MAIVHLEFNMGGHVDRFEGLVAWQRARALYRIVRSLTKRPGFDRDFALGNQITKAARSTMANIAEGFERSGPREFAHHLSIANGSNAEVRSDLYCASDCGYITENELETLQDQAREVGRLVGALRQSLIRSIRQATSSE